MEEQRKKKTDDRNIIYIPLGSSCSLAYQLDKYNLRKESYPFDWILSRDKEIINILKDEFRNFLDIEYLQAKNKSSNFPIIDEFWNDNKNDKDNIIRVYHKLYKITFVHDFKNFDELEMNSAKIKYDRRIKRFLEHMRDPNIKKIVIHIGNTFNHQIFDELFKTLNYTNYEIKFLSHKEIGYTSDWKMDEFDWKHYFSTIK